MISTRPRVSIRLVMLAGLSMLVMLFGPSFGTGHWLSRGFRPFPLSHARLGVVIVRASRRRVDVFLPRLRERARVTLLPIFDFFCGPSHFLLRRRLLIFDLIRLLGLIIRLLVLLLLVKLLLLVIARVLLSMLLLLLRVAAGATVVTSTSSWRRPSDVSEGCQQQAENSLVEFHPRDFVTPVRVLVLSSSPCPPPPLLRSATGHRIVEWLEFVYYIGCWLCSFSRAFVFRRLSTCSKWINIPRVLDAAACSLKRSAAARPARPRRAMRRYERSFFCRARVWVCRFRM